MDRCVYCQKELVFPWERIRSDCDDCRYAAHETYSYDHLEEQMMEE